MNVVIALLAVSQLPLIEGVERPYKDAYTRYSGYISEAENSYYGGDYKTALGRYRNIYKTSEKSGKQKIGRIGAGWSLLGMKKYADALAEFKGADILARDQQSRTLVLLGRGIARYNVKKYPEAFGDFVNVVENFPEWKEAFSLALYYAAYTAFSNRDYGSVVKYASKYADKFTDHNLAPDASLLLARGYIEQGKYGMASKVLGVFADKYPMSPLLPEARVLRAEALAMNGDYKGAFGTFESLLNTYPFLKEKVEESVSRLVEKFGDRIVSDTSFSITHPLLVDLVLYKPAAAYYKKGQLARAMPRYMRLARDFPADPRAAKGLALVGQAFYKQDSYDRAAQVFTEYISKYPNGADLTNVYSLLAYSYLRMRDYKTALTYFDELAYRFPNDKLAGDAMTKMKAILAKNPGAASNYEFKTPGFATDAAFETAVSAYQAGDMERAATLFLDFYNKYPGERSAGKALFNAGYIYYQAKVYDKAIAPLAEYVKNYPSGENVVDAVFNLGASLYFNKNYAEAVRTLESFVKTYPNSQYKPHAYKIAGLSYVELDDGSGSYKARACAAFSRAAEVFRAQGNPGEAEKLEGVVSQMGCR